MPRIKLLDKKTIEKIAAGEVIERPASIVKELVENSLDAGSKNIIVEIKDGGKSYIRITDDGIGIDEDDLELAFKRHSTSKINSLEDLYSIRSLGFRGEALSSISHVARVEIMSKTSQSLSGINAKIEEGSVISKEVVGTPKGTTMIVRDLFYNLPVREKFLKSERIESNQIVDIVYKIALGNRDVSFKLIRDNKVILRTSRNNKALEHIYSVLGKEFRDNMVEIGLEESDLTIRGYISNNTLYRSNRSHQYIYVNGRYIDSDIITAAIEKNYRSIIPLNRFPIFILFIDIDPKVIDINIHPTKQEIKFINEDELIEKLSSLVDETLRKIISIPEINFKNKRSKNKEEELPNLFDMPQKSLNQDTDPDQDDIIIKDLTSPEADQVDERDYKNNQHYNHKSRHRDRDYKDFSIEENHTFQDQYKDREGLEAGGYGDFHKKQEDQQEDSQARTQDIDNLLSNLKPLGVIFKTYILAEDELNQKLYFIDQHAAHERVMYEKYLDEFNREAINSQQLIAPEIIELTNIEMNTVLNNMDLFHSLGFDLDEFGKNNIAIRSVPLIFGHPNIKTLFYDILDNMDRDISSNYDLYVDKIMKIACTKAIKSGDSMSELEILSLFHSLKKTREPNSCPHGRPTILEMTKKDIEKAFLRIM